MNSRKEIEAKVKADYATALGTVIEVDQISGYVGDDSVDLVCIVKVKCRVISTPEGDLLHWNDTWCDPYWNVEPVEPLSQPLRSAWVFGPSYEVSRG